MIKKGLFGAALVRNEKGQVAIFVALIFQILFLFFAMVINVGLLVHHKINLQNSVDIAAYYGAAKQAENLNVIGHMNYQIRQSWKLLVFRYRQLGTAGELNSNGNDHPFNKGNGGLVRPDESGTGSHPDFFENPPFCITYRPFKPMPDAENTCKNSAEDARSVALFKAPSIIAGFQTFSRSIRAATEALLSSATNRCKVMGSYNYITLGKFVASYNIDQSSRMDVIRQISDSMSENKDTFTDVDGGDVRAGMLETLKANLTAPNRDSLKDSDVQTINSLAEGTCGIKGQGEFRNWLVPVKILPGFSYIDTLCDGTKLQSVTKELSSTALPQHISEAPGDFVSWAKDLAPFIGFDQSNIFNKYNLSLGVEKNPWCMGYVGIRASTQPKIPFSPLGSIVLVARAIAKPFAGRVGPWYGKEWSASANKSLSPPGESDAKVDLLVPPRIVDTSIFSNPKGFTDPFRIANYSRFVGDRLGYKSRQTLGFFGRAIFRLDPTWSTDVIPDPKDPGTDGESPNFEHWSHLPTFIGAPGGDDILAWNGSGNRKSDMRFLELLSILPDQFDVTYYPIEPEFYDAYYTRLKRGLGAKLNIAKDIRADIGSRVGTEYEKYSIKDQYKEIENKAMFKKLKFDWEENFRWTTDDFNNLYTGWSPVSMIDFNINREFFGKCGYERKDGEAASPGSCISQGGMTGYAVKLVSKEFLKRSDLKLGGENTSGAILNPPPDKF